MIVDKNTRRWIHAAFVCWILTAPVGLTGVIVGTTHKHGGMLFSVSYIGMIGTFISMTTGFWIRPWITKEKGGGESK